MPDGSPFVDGDARLILPEDAEDMVWERLLDERSLQQVWAQQRELEQRKGYEHALMNAFGFHSITAEPGLQGTLGYVELLEVLANAYHVGVRLSRGPAGQRLSLHITSDEDFERLAQGQAAMQALVVPISCTIERFRDIAGSIRALYEEMRGVQLELEREDQTIRYVQRSALLRHLWRHRSRVTSGEMTDSCVRLRGLCNQIGLSLFRGNELLISDHYALREDGVGVVPWNWWDGGELI